MNATARLTFNRQYFESKYDDWLKHRAKWRRFAIPFSCVLVLFGFASLYCFRDQWMFGGFVTVAGIAELMIALTHKRRWVNGCLGATCADKTVEIRFENDSMNSSSKNGNVLDENLCF